MLCAKSNVSCTFLAGPAKKHQPRIPEASLALSRDVDEDRSEQSRTPTTAETNSQLPFQSILDLQNNQPATGEDALQGSPDGHYYGRQTIFAGQLDANPAFNFDMIDFGTPCFNEPESAQQIGMLPEQSSPPNINMEILDNDLVPTRQKYTFDSGAPLVANPIEGKDGVHGVYFGLSGDTDPYLLRHFKYDEKGEFRMFKLTYRQLASGFNQGGTQATNSLRSLGSGLLQENSCVGSPRSNTGDGPVPTYFMMAADDLGDCGKEDTSVRNDASPQAVRMELDRLILPEDGSRLFGL